MIKVPDIIIAVDGFSSTGKSTFAKEIARTFGFMYLDSGALYRGVTLFAQENGLISEDNTIGSDLEQTMESLDLHFGLDGLLYLGERCIESEIRGMKVSSQVSPVSTLPFVRRYVDERLHKLSSGGRVVMDGRDIGTTVFPKAELKIFMIARDEVRAQRRFDEMRAKGGNPIFEDVIANLRERDYIDSHRSASPLRKADDAFVIDNSDMTMSEELSWVMGLIQGKFGILK
ncbi:MAG TPA: (d)CMP kinase [Rikenellaceae bacterium]|nr:(d)CMP kinase [Rikenellaceae bacterium]